MFSYDQRSEETAESAKTAKAIFLRVLSDLCGSIFYVCLRSTAARVRLPVTLAVVRNMSGIVSTASRMPMPSTGRSTAARTGTMAMMLPPGTPGTANELSITVNTTEASCAGDKVMPYKRARNNTPTGIATAAPMRNTDAASGRTNRDTIGGNWARSPLSTIAGSAASDERDANATACAGAQNDTNAFGDIAPATIPTG